MPESIKLPNFSSSLSREHKFRKTDSREYSIAEIIEATEERKNEELELRDKLWRKTVESFNGENNKLREKVEKLEQNIESSNSRSFAILAIFTAVFTFISVNINIFNRIEKFYQAVGFMSLNAFLTLIIISVPLLILKSFDTKGNFPKQANRMLWRIFFVGILFLILPLIISFFVSFPYLEIVEKMQCECEVIN